MAKPPTLNAALSALQQHLTARTPLAPEALAVLQERLRGRRVITLDSGALDSRQTLEDLAWCETTGEDSAGEDHKTLAEALSSARAQLPACPVTRQPLRLVKKAGEADKLITKDGIDWAGVPEELRLVAAYAAELRTIGGDRAAAEEAAYELRQKEPPPPWPRLIKAWTTLVKQKSPSAADAGLVARVQARVLFQAPPTAAERPAPRPLSTVLGAVANLPNPPPEDPPAPTGRVCADCGTDESNHNGLRHNFNPGRGAAPRPLPEPRAAAPLVVCIAAPTDYAALQTFKAMMAGFVQRGEIRLWEEGDIAPGANPGGERSRALGQASAILYFVSADLLSQRGGQVEAYQETYRGAHHIPVLLRPCLHDSAFPGRHAIPEKPISQFSDRDAAWLTVCQAVMRALS